MGGQIYSQNGYKHFIKLGLLKGRSFLLAIIVSVAFTHICEARSQWKIINWRWETNIIIFQNLATNQQYQISTKNIQIADVKLLKQNQFGIASAIPIPDSIRLQILQHGIGWLKNWNIGTYNEKLAQISGYHFHRGIWQYGYIERHCSIATRTTLYRFQNYIKQGVEEYQTEMAGNNTVTPKNVRKIRIHANRTVAHRKSQLKGRALDILYQQLALRDTTIDRLKKDIDSTKKSNSLLVSALNHQLQMGKKKDKSIDSLNKAIAELKQANLNSNFWDKFQQWARNHLEANVISLAGLAISLSGILVSVVLSKRKKNDDATRSTPGYRYSVRQ